MDKTMNKIDNATIDFIVKSRSRAKIQPLLAKLTHEAYILGERKGEERALLQQEYRREVDQDRRKTARYRTLSKVFLLLSAALVITGVYLLGGY